MHLFMLLLGCKPLGRNTEQHDVFFGIAETVKDLISDLQKFWPEATDKLHVDAWREVNCVDGYRIRVSEKTDKTANEGDPKLFFINLGGYTRGVFDEPHYKMLTVQTDMAKAIQQAKSTGFFKEVNFEGANSHVDDKYGVDVDDFYEVGDILPEGQKKKYRLEIFKDEQLKEDVILLGYFKLNRLP